MRWMVERVPIRVSIARVRKRYCLVNAMNQVLVYE